MKFICNRKSQVHLIFRVTKRPWKTISDDAFYITLSLSLSLFLSLFPPSLSLYFFFMTFLFLYPFNIQGKIEGISISIVQKKYRARIILTMSDEERKQPIRICKSLSLYYLINFVYKLSGRKWALQIFLKFILVLCSLIS